MDDVFFYMWDSGCEAASLKHAQFQHNQQTTHTFTRPEQHFGSFSLPHPVVLTMMCLKSARISDTFVSLVSPLLYSNQSRWEPCPRNPHMVKLGTRKMYFFQCGFRFFSDTSGAIVLQHYELYLPLADLGACVEDGHTDGIYRQEKQAIVQSERLQ
jgi:hypothetical protein